VATFVVNNPVYSATLYSNYKLLITNGRATLTPRLEAFSDDGEILTRPISASLIIDGEEHELKQYTTNTPGHSIMYANAEGVDLNSIEVTFREDKVREEISLPVLFILAHTGEPIGTGANMTAESVQGLLNSTNSPFNNFDPQDQNSVSMNLSFRLATTDEYGATLEEPGILRFDASSYDKYNNQKFNKDEATSMVLGLSRSARKMMTVVIGKGDLEVPNFAYLPHLPFGTGIKLQLRTHSRNISSP